MITSQILHTFGFLVSGGQVLGALLTGEPKLMALGVVTTPAIVAMVIAIVKIYRAHRQAG